jgi:hypothetical protein
MNWKLGSNGVNCWWKIVTISKLDRKTNEYIRGKMDAQDMILNDITWKQLIWYGHVERMDPARLPRIMIYWQPEGRKQRGLPPENLE